MSLTPKCPVDQSPSPAPTQQNEFEKYPELARRIEHFANTATNVSLKDWWSLLDALNDALIAASRGTRALTEAASDVVAERHRQVSQEGWSPDHDDEHNTGELARAAACYAIGELLFRPMNHHNGFPDLQAIWPWDPQWWKPGDARRNLVKAGALIIAEIERLDRLTGEPST